MGRQGGHKGSAHYRRRFGKAMPRMRAVAVQKGATGVRGHGDWAGTLGRRVYPADFAKMFGAATVRRYARAGRRSQFPRPGRGRRLDAGDECRLCALNFLKVPKDFFEFDAPDFPVSWKNNSAILWWFELLMLVLPVLLIEQMAPD